MIKKRPNKRFFEMLGYTPFDIQAQIHESRAPIRTACLGRQLGKAKRQQLKQFSSCSPTPATSAG